MARGANKLRDGREAARHARKRVRADKNAPRRARHKRVRPSRVRLGSPRHARTLANSRYCSAPNGEERSPHFDYSLLASLIEVLVRTAKTRRPLCVHFLAKVLRRLEVVVSRRRAPGLLTLEPQHEIVDADREAAHADAGRVPDRIGDRADRAGDADLADALDAERIDVRIVLVDQSAPRSTARRHSPAHGTRRDWHS